MLHPAKAGLATETDWATAQTVVVGVVGAATAAGVEDAEMAMDRAMAAEEVAEVRAADWAGCDTLECAVVAWVAAAVVAVEGVAARAAEFQAMVAVGLAVMAKGRL